MSHVKLAVLVALVGMFAARGATAQIINGSFENPVVPVAGGALFSTGTSFDSGEWTVVGPLGEDVAVVSEAYTDGAYTFPAHSGDQWIDLSGNGNTLNEGVVQTVPTTPGVVYDLGFFIGNLSGGSYGTNSTVRLSINGGAATLYTNSIAGTTLAWQEFHHGFLATGASTSIAFLNGDSSIDGSNALDSVTMNAVPALAHVVNGSFESPVASNVAGDLFRTGTLFDSGEWTVIGAPGANVAIVTGDYTDGAFTFPAHDGNQWMDLSGAGNTLNEGVVQTLATTPGVEYDLEFFIGNLSGGTYNIDSTVRISIDGGAATSYTNSIPGATLAWQEFHHSFIATGASTSISFLNGDPINDGSNALDSVSVSAPPTGFEADFDSDTDVDDDDLAQWEDDYGVNGFSDADGDGHSTGLDFLVWQQQYGNGVETLTAASAAVPEPSLTALLSWGVLLASYRIRRQIV